MTSRVLRSAVLMAATLLLAACTTEAQWSKAGTSTRQQFSDQDRCRAWASIKAEKELRLNQESLPNSSSGSGEDYRARMMVFEARKRRTALFERCMREGGYRKVETKR